MGEETLLMVGGPMDGALHSRDLSISGTVYGAPIPKTDEGRYIIRKYLLPDDETVLKCWVWTEGMRGLEEEF